MEEGREEKIMERLFQEATKAVFSRFTVDIDLEPLALQFADGIHVTTGESLPSNEYKDIIRKIDGLAQAIEILIPNANAANQASAVEFILEGLHINQMLNKDRVGGRTTYSS